MIARPVAALFLLAIACSTASSGPQPDIQLAQLSNVGDAARHMTGGVSVQYQLSIHNTTSDALRIRRVDLQSVGMGAYSLPATTRAFDVALAPGETRTIDLWGAAVIDAATIVGANGPVTIRAVVQFDAPSRQFQSVVVQQVNAGR